MKWSEKRKIAFSILAKEKGFGKWMKGREMSTKTKNKMSLARKGKPFSGVKCDWNGKKHSKISKLKMSLSAKGRKASIETIKKMSGKNCHLWRGGISKNRKEYYRFKCLERYARKKNAEGSHTLQEWGKLKKQFNYICVFCKKKEPEIKLTEDHIIPLSCGGNNFISNIQPLCKSCNSKKGNKKNPRIELSVEALSTTTP